MRRFGLLAAVLAVSGCGTNLLGTGRVTPRMRAACPGVPDSLIEPIAIAALAAKEDGFTF